jgi:hypothetical protein
MQWHKLIFSEQKQIRLLRHLLFWAWWSFYFLLFNYLAAQPRPVVSGGETPTTPVNISTRKTGYIILDSEWIIKTVLLITLYVVACYVFIYLLLPQLLKRKWLFAVSNIIALCIFLFVSVWFLYWNVFPFIDSLSGDPKVNDYFAPFWPAFYLGIVNASKVIVFAAIIKYVKYWWAIQKEKEKLEREKINAELQLLKAQVHPDFLFKTLNNIYSRAKNNSPNASLMLLKLSDLLSYMLYDCDKPLVPLDKEMEMMKEYMQLERIRQNNEPEIEVSIKGDLNNKYIPPFLLLPFIENSFSHFGHLTEQTWINLNIVVEGDYFVMKLANGISPQTQETISSNGNGLTNVQKRLNLLYPGTHELKINSEQEMFIVFLNFHLEQVPANSVEEKSEFNLSSKVVLNYAE